MTPDPQSPVASTLLPAGTPAPDFTLPQNPDAPLRLSYLRGRPVILLFYPADWSPVCGDEVALMAQLSSGASPARRPRETISVRRASSSCATRFPDGVNR